MERKRIFFTLTLVLFLLGGLFSLPSSSYANHNCLPPCANNCGEAGTITPVCSDPEHVNCDLVNPQYCGTDPDTGNACSLPGGTCTVACYEVLTPCSRTDSPACPIPTPTPAPIPVFPDLVVENLNPSWNPSYPTNIIRLTTNSGSFSGIVANRGIGNAGQPSEAALFMFYNIFAQSSTDPLPARQLLDVGSLGSQASQPVNWLISDIPPGLHFYLIYADALNAVEESINENNNYNVAFFWGPAPSSFTLNQPATPSCSGTSSGPVNLSWTPSNYAQNYEVWRIEAGGNWVNLTSTPATFYTDPTVQNNTVYVYTIVATNDSGRTLPSNNPVYFLVQTPPCNPPIITSLEIKNVGNTTTFAGSNVSGRQSTQQGSDWFNPIQVTLSAQANPIGSGNSIKEYYINFSPGFRLEYRSTQPDSTTYAPFVVSDDNIITNITAFPEGFRLIERDRFVGLLKHLGTNSTDSRWEVTFDQNFGDRNMNITGRVKDQNNLCGDTNGNIVSCDNNVDLNSVQRVIR